MKNRLTTFLLLTCGLCFGQNLVPNPSFELMTACPPIGTCPTDIGQICFIPDWRYPLQSPDYYNRCCTNGVASVPQNFLGTQEALPNNNAYIGVNTLAIDAGLDIREFIGAKLIDSLAIGQKYFASMKVSLADCILCSANNIGMLFLTDTIQYPFPMPIPNRAQVFSASIISDTSNWTLVSGSFIADSSYKYLFLGNFFDDAHTNSITVNGNPCFPSPNCNSYYYIDEICVSTDSLACNMTVGIIELKQNAAVSLFPNPFSKQLTFTLSANAQTTVSLYNFFGQQVLQQTFTNSTTINTEQMQDGIYFYELRNAQGFMGKGKVIRQ